MADKTPMIGLTWNWRPRVCLLVEFNQAPYEFTKLSLRELRKQANFGNESTGKSRPTKDPVEGSTCPRVVPTTRSSRLACGPTRPWRPVNRRRFDAAGGECVEKRTCRRGHHPWRCDLGLVAEHAQDNRVHDRDFAARVVAHWRQLRSRLRLSPRRCEISGLNFLRCNRECGRSVLGKTTNVAASQSLPIRS
jgi:hypothetical protein